MKKLLLEIGSEEIPARFVPIGLALLKEDILRLLDESSIKYGEISEYSTPRRLALLIDNVAEQQEDRTIESLGPPKKAAFDSDGKPTKAASGFAKSLNIDVKDLVIKSTERGEYVSATVEKKGISTITVLSEALPGLISTLQLPKSMRWGSSALKYFRPIQWILAILGKEIIPFELDSIKSSNISYGHRFLSPVALKIDQPSSYLQSLKQNHVLADPAERKKSIAEGIKKLEISAQYKIHKDEDLLDTVTNLVEYPTAVLGDFEDKYLELPGELLITVMKTHQKYFSMEDDESNMQSSFVVISNMTSDINDTVKRGAERVLRARLEDARFYYFEDQKIALNAYVDDLKKVTFQEKLGSVYEKTLRVSTLCSFLADELNLPFKEQLARAAMLCKADLVTGIVGEFPELQGYMGMKYALNSGEDKELASALHEHYLPKFAGDILPQTPMGSILSVADKMDNITSFFFLDMVPTGSEDPFALRRQAMGVVNILQKTAHPISLNTLIDRSLQNLESSPEKRRKLTDQIVQFFRQRLEGVYLSQGFTHDIVNAVLAAEELDMTNINRRIHALASLKKDPAFPSMLMAAKRAYNILSKVQPGAVNEVLLSDPSEKGLFSAVGKVRETMGDNDYTALFELEDPINTFFESVLVMDKNPDIKENRLALLLTVKDTFDSLADFSKIQE